jgi:hypothetical protein
MAPSRRNSGTPRHWSTTTFDLLVEAVSRTALTMNPPMSRTYRANLRQARQGQDGER